jgi:hypothetical protein
MDGSVCIALMAQSRLLYRKPQSASPVQSQGWASSPAAVMRVEHVLWGSSRMLR